MSERITVNPESNEKFDAAFKKLQRIHSVLKEMGFRIWDYAASVDNFREQWNNETAFPLVWDGGNGIRVSPNKRTGLMPVWFTNSFEEPSHPKRLAVEKRLKDEGLWER